MKEVVQALNDRIKAPYFGYAILSFIALNWRGFFLLFVSDGKPEERLALFDAQTDIFTLLLWPLAFGALVAATTKWLAYIFAIIEKKPNELIENLNLEAEHKMTIKQSQLEQSRSKLFAVKEEELIDRAKRDEELASIEDSEAKEKLIEQLNSIRRERDMLSNELVESKKAQSELSKEAQEIMIAASSKEDGSIMKTVTKSGKDIQAGNKSFGSEGYKSFAKYESALSELLKNEFVKELGQKGEVFELTHKGREWVDAL